MMLIDNTVLSNFALVDELGLLKDYCKNKGCMTNHVLAEFEQGIRQGIFIDVKLIRKDRIRLETGNKVLRDFIVYGYFSPVDRLNEFL